MVTQMVKNLPAVQEIRVWSLGQEDPLEKGMATHSGILAWRIPWANMTDQLKLSLFFFSSVNPSLPFYPSPASCPGNHVCFLHLWLSFCFVNMFICTVSLESTYKRYNVIFVFLWLTSLSMTISRSFHISASGLILSFYMDKLYSIVYMYHTCIHSSVDGRLGCFHVLNTVNTAAMSIGVRVSFWIMVFFRYMPRIGIVWSYNRSVLVF